MKKTITEISSKDTKSKKVTTKSKLNVAAYCRVSTESDEQMNSLANQKEYFEKLIKSHEDWNFVDIYYDEGISGTSLKKRDGFNKMIADALAGKIDMIVVKSISRFSRNTVDALQTIRNLRNHDIRIFFEKESIDSNDIKSEFMLTIMSSLAQEESQSLSENVKWGKRKIAQKGFVQIPYSNVLGFQQKGKYGIEIDREQAKTVVLIYDMYLHGKTTGEIIKKLIEDGTPTPTGLEASHWCNTAVLSILRNEKYCGDAILQKTYTKDFLNHKKCINYDAFPKYYVKNNHEEIIPRATWEYTQELLEKYSKRSVNVRYGDLIFCSACGHKYRRFHRYHKYYEETILSYRCLGKYDKSTNCNNITLFEKQLDELYHETVLQLLSIYKKELLEYFKLTIPKVIKGKRKSNRIIKLLDNMISFIRSDYEYYSLHILIKNILVHPDKTLEFTTLDGNIIKTSIPKYRLVDHYGRKKTSGY